MKNVFENKKIIIGPEQSTVFANENNVYQDGTSPMYRDVDGSLWAMSGHSHLGSICVFRGTCLDDLRKLYEIKTDFKVGHADRAFNGIRYPDGVRARGSMWPFGLYICPNTHRFFCFFYNETGWAGEGTAYDAQGPCEAPAYDSDFRHIGLMHSDDEGKTWQFDRWILSGEQVGFTENYNPNGDVLPGQKNGRISLSSGDFSLFVNPLDDYLYLIYNVIHVNTYTSQWEDCDVYIARARKRTDGVMSDFVKYYEGSFCEPGNLGRATPIVRNSWHPRVVYSEVLKTYIMSSVMMSPGALDQVIVHRMQLRTGSNLTDWSDPIDIMNGEEYFGEHYVGVYPNDTTGSISVLRDCSFSILKNGNGTDVIRQKCKWE